MYYFESTIHFPRPACLVVFDTIANVPPKRQTMVNRRDFLKIGAASGAGLVWPWPADGHPKAFYGVSRALTPFVDPMPIPPVLTPTGTMNGDPLYEISAQQVQLQLHRDLQPTILWGYNGIVPGPTLKVNTNETIHVKWINDLRDNSGAYLTSHYLPVDLCLHGPDVAGNTPRIVTHVHGGHTPWTSDGFPDHTQLPGEEIIFTYPNAQEAATIWYHDHAMGITRLNVYMGLFGLYLISDSIETGLNLPQGDYDIPLVIGDRAFNDDGSLIYPSAWQQHYFGDVTLVNGKAFPYFEVEPRKYRLRIVNGSNARTYTLAFDNNLTIHQIGSDGGFLSETVALTTLTLSPAERADVIVDFSGQSGNIVLTNSASAPYTAPPGVGNIPNVMQFRVSGTATDTSSLPTTIRPVPPLLEADAVRTRTFNLGTVVDTCVGQGIKWTINGLGWMDVTEFIQLDTVEIWEFVNNTGRIHPMHIHLVRFQILDRTSLNSPNSVAVPPDPNEAGWKDTVLVNANETVRVIAKFEDYTGNFVYHCHILEHEDHEMMRQFVVADDLPVELEAFYARIDRNSVGLFWSTLTEQNNTGFEIQRAVRSDQPSSQLHTGSALSWERVGWVEGTGTTLERQTYTFRLNDHPPGRYLFRLKQIDLDGTFVYSEEVEIFVAIPEAFVFTEAYPNPFQTAAQIGLTVATDQEVSVEVFDSLGRQVANLFKGILPAQVVHRFQFAAHDLPNGVYTIRAKGAHFDQARTLVLSR